MKKFFLIASMILFSGFIGCGNGNTKITGKVTFEDGSPLTAGMVVFDNGVITSRAPIQPDGTFTVGTAREKDGIPPGDYRVCLAGAVEMLDNPQGIFPPPSRPLIDRKWTTPETSGLSFTVEKSSQTYNIVVTPP
ncbi:MAG: hypothetical protein LBQ54_11375 [Planctomycetaceae bacterium]|jgi:hypothetical protein|nr:hypothetical protein [Planctomycetaceae bacterium]